MLTGSQTPRLCNVPDYDSSIWPAAEKVLAGIGFSLDEWQQNILRGVLGVDAEKHFTSPNVLMIVPRQNGKNHVLAARQFVGMFMLKERAIHTGHELGTAREHFRFLLRIIKDAGWESKFKIRDNNQEISIELLGSTAKLYFKARSKDAGRGYAGFDALYFDEAYALQSEQMAAILPTLSAKSMDGHTQIWYTSSAGMPSSDVLARFRSQCMTKPDRWAFYEWSVPKGSNIQDVNHWASANPAFNIRISEEYIRSNEYSAMAADQFGRERLGIWNEEGLETVIAPDTWDAGNIPTEAVPSNSERVSLSIEVSADSRYASVALATEYEDGIFVEVLAHQPGTDWVAGVVNRFRQSKKVVEIVTDSSGAVLGLVPELRRQGIKVKTIPLTEVKAACAVLLSEIYAGHVYHTDDLSVRHVVTSAGKRGIGEVGWAWKRLGAVDVTPLVALTFAHYSWSKYAIRHKKIRRAVDLPL